MVDAARPDAVAGRGVADLLRGVVTDIGEALDLWSVDLWTFSGDADTLACRAYWCRDPVAAKSGDCVGAVIGLDQSHDLRRLVLAAEVVERHVDDELSPADAGALAQAGFTSRIDVPLLAGAEVLGVLSLAETRKGRRLTRDERALLATLARLAAAALRGARLAEDEAERVQRLTGLLAGGRGIAAALSPAEIVAAVREQAAGLAAGVVCEADVVLRQDDGTFARAGEGPESRGSGWRADALARQAVDLGRAEQARTADGRARLLVPLTAGRALARVSGDHGAAAPVVSGDGARARHAAGRPDRRGARARSSVARAAEPLGDGHPHRPVQPLVLLRAAVRGGGAGASLSPAALAGGRRARRRGGPRPVARPRLPGRGARGHGAAAPDESARQGRRRLPAGRRQVRALASQHPARAGVRRARGRTACAGGSPPRACPTTSWASWAASP